MRRIIAALAVVVVTAVLAGFAPPASAATVTYVEPVAGRVTDPFRPPKTPYGAGNRGLQYDTVPGSVARASAAGRVTFAGQVGGALHVVVQHADGVRTSESFLRTVRVRAGQVVTQGEAIGTTGSSFHFGARIGDAYIDPAILLASGPARVHLVPDGEFSEEGAGDDHRALFSVVADRIGSITSEALGWVRDGAGDALGNAGDAARTAVEHAIGLLDEIVNLGQFAGPFATLAAALADILEAFIEACTPPERDPPPMADSGNRIAVFVAGLGSKSSSQLSEDFRARDLGYAPENVYDFSYRGGRRRLAYEADDTTGDLRSRARDLRDLLDQIALDRPGAEVDLVAHSQGGLIAREALADHYDGEGRALPRVRRVVTLGTPHHGSDAATALAWLRWSPGGQAIRELARRRNQPFDLTGPGIAQLAETSDFIRELNNRPLRDGVTYTSIAASEDAIVPAPRSRLAGARNVLVDVGNVETSHSALHESHLARHELALALADAPPTCQPLFVTIDRALTGAVVATVEDAAGAAGAAGAAAAHSTNP